MVDYTLNMHIVDKVDLLLSCEGSLRKKDIARINSYYMYLVKKGFRPSFLEFSHTMLRQMVADIKSSKCHDPMHCD